MAKSCKCKKGEECEECPEWIFTFADLVMLMMGFFVILFVLKPEGKKGATSNTQAEERKQWLHTVGEIRKGFGYTPDPRSGDPVDQAFFQKANGDKNGAENDQPRDNATGLSHDVQTVRPGKQAVVGGRLGFDAGATKLRPDTTHILDEIADIIRGHTNIVLVKGHASLDDLPDNSSAEQRMDLSLRRAQTAADYLMSRGVSPEVLRVQGCSTFEPVRQRAYDSNAQSENRRVEVETTSEIVDDRKDPSVNPNRSGEDSEPPPAAEKKEQAPPKTEGAKE